MSKKKNKPANPDSEQSVHQQHSLPASTQRVTPPSRQPQRSVAPPQTFQRGQQQPTTSPHMSPQTPSLGRLLHARFLPFVVLIVLALLPSVYFYHKSQQADQKNTTPSSSNLQTTAEVVKRVSRHILLPSGEQPTVATVSDASKVRNQSFFSNAATGDKVLIYAQAKEAYLYRPSIDRVVEVAPLAPSKTSQ